MKTKLLLPLFFASLILSVQAADKVKCFKYNSKKGTFKDSMKKSCNGKSWFTTEELAVADAKTDCDKKIAKDKARWDEARKLCVSTRKDNKNLKKCEKVIDKIKSYKNQEYSFKIGQLTLSNSSLDSFACKDVATSEVKVMTKLASCFKKLEKMNAKIDKKNAGDKQSIQDVFVDGKCDKKKIRQSKGASDKRCETLKAKIDNSLIEKFEMTNICENPTKADLKKLKQLNKCERKASKNKPFVFEPSSGKCVNLKKSEDMSKVVLKPMELTSAKKAQCLKLTQSLKRSAKGQYVSRKHLEKLKKKGCINY